MCHQRTLSTASGEVKEVQDVCLVEECASRDGAIWKKKENDLLVINTASVVFHHRHGEVAIAIAYVASGTGWSGELPFESRKVARVPGYGN